MLGSNAMTATQFQLMDAHRFALSQLVGLALELINHATDVEILFCKGKKLVMTEIL